LKRRIAGLRERAESARNVDDPRGRRFAEQWEHGLRYSDRADEVHLKGALDRFEAARRGRPVTLGGYAGVVDENVEAAEIRVDSLGSSGDGARIIEIDRNVADIQVFRRELGRRFFTQGLAPRADQDGAA
jgi:hypothetical protein